MNNVENTMEVPFMSDYMDIMKWRGRCLGYFYHAVIGAISLNDAMNKIFEMERLWLTDEIERGIQDASRHTELDRAETFYREQGIMESLEMLNIFSGFDLEILSTIPLFNREANSILPTSNPADVILTLWRYYQGLERPLHFHYSINELPWAERTRNRFYLADFVLRFGLLTQCGKQFSQEIYPEHNVYFLNNPFNFVREASFYAKYNDFKEKSYIIYPPKNFWDEIVEFEPEYYLERMQSSGYFPPEFLEEFRQFLSHDNDNVHALEGMVDLRETLIFEPDEYHYREPYFHGEPQVEI